VELRHRLDLVVDKAPACLAEEHLSSRSNNLSRTLAKDSLVAKLKFPQVFLAEFHNNRLRQVFLVRLRRHNLLKLKLDYFHSLSLPQLVYLPKSRQVD
jgi:hypothetical protein